MRRAVLTFHSIDDSGAVLSFPPRSFARLIDHFAKSGTPVVRFDELVNLEHGVTITFDDGMRSVHDRALPVLRHHGFPAHLFLATGSVGRDNSWPSPRETAARFDMMSWDEVETCASHGVMIESHTVTHPDLRALTPAQISDECEAADREIERRTGRRPALMAYPFGLFDDNVRRAVAPRYEGCFSTRLAYLDAKFSLSDIPRVDSYYLQPSVLHRRLFSVPVRRYVWLRSNIRRLRGIT